MFKWVCYKFSLLYELFQRTHTYQHHASDRVAFPVGTFEQGVVARSNDNIRVIRAVYELGQFSIVDLINEQRRLMESQREFTETLVEQYRALADLQAALGIPVN